VFFYISDVISAVVLDSRITWLAVPYYS